MELEKRKASYTKAVVVREDATHDEMEDAKQRAQDAWEKSGRTASWGCEWYHIWLQKVTEAVAQGQRLQVVFFAGQVGAGKVAMQELAHEDLWNGTGLGGSQKAEVATLDLKRQTEGPDWEYDQIDVADFLRSQFQIGMTVDAWREDSWCRGTLVTMPDSFIAKPEEMFWQVSSKATGQLFQSQHLRHVTDSVQKLLRSIGTSVGAVQILKEPLQAWAATSMSKTTEATEKLLEALGHDVFKKMVKDRLTDALPKAIAVGTTSESSTRWRHNTPSLAVTIRVQDIEALQRLRDQVLGGDLEVQINSRLQTLGCTSEVEVDQTQFCEILERRLLGFSQLTEHQKEVLKRFKKECRYHHLAAPAGSGKTFVAVQYTLDMLGSHSTGSIIYVAPSLSLAFFFLQWIATRYAADEPPEIRFGKLRALFDRVASLTEDSGETFLLAVYDESHHVFRPGHPDVFSAIRANQVLLLSDESQSLLDHSFPGVQMQKECLQEVIRCTQRVISGSAAFLSSADSRGNIRSRGTIGPPLKAFLFDANAGSLFAGAVQRYAEHTAKALWHILQKYPGVSLHRRIALLVPDIEFLDEFRPELREALRSNFGRNFVLKSSQESMSFLPKYLSPDMSILEDDEEVIVFDAVENVAGLEQLFVILIGLDAKIEHTGKDAVA
eukprot:Skav235958  [mRNA]  locus=scaffold592:34814:37549:- [translate_table: standard]